MPRQPPDRPNLEQLKKQAKSLLRAAQQRDTDALRRFTALPAFSSTLIERIDVRDLALHDAQSVAAREHGFPSWTALRDEVEARTLSFEAAVDEFLRSATGGASGRANRLLALHPSIAPATLQTALVLADAEAVEARLRDHPELATQPGGPQNWEPLLYVCHTCMHVADPARVAGLVTIARQLCALGANPNAEYHWNWHPELPRTALWGAICAVRHLPLASVLLEAGANPTDGVSVHIAGGGGHIDALELLHRYGVNVNGIPGGVPPLVYMMTWAENPAGPYWLLEHGADPNLAWGMDGEAPCTSLHDTNLKDGFVEVKFKPISGREDQAGGLVWRAKDANNYYVARANALEDNVTIYHTINGRRTERNRASMKVAANQWHTLRVEFQGAHFTVMCDGKKALDWDDLTFKDAGKVGVWTKADSVTAFDDFSYGEK